MAKPNNEFQQHAYGEDGKALLHLQVKAAQAYRASVDSGGEAQYVALDENGEFFVTDDRNDMAAFRWVCRIEALSDPDGYVRDAAHAAPAEGGTDRNGRGSDGGVNPFSPIW